MPRTIRPELLDALSPHHPDALHNRRDLRLTNRLMGNHRWFRRVLPARVARNEPVLEIGAGTGELALQLVNRGYAIDALDLWPPPDDWPPERRWHVEDLRTFSRYDEYPVIIANLILHQFQDAELAALGAQWRATARVIMACEPVRRRFSQQLYRAAGPLFGANHVSMHDAHVSIDAGFRDDELPRVLGLQPAAWDVVVDTTLLGAYRLIAVRRP